MPLENGHDGKEKKYPEKLRHEIDEGEAADKIAVSRSGGSPARQFGTRRPYAGPGRNRNRNQGRDNARVE